MSPRAVSFGFAAVTLAGSLFVCTRSLWFYGPLIYFPFLGAPAVAVMMALRASIVRMLGGGADPLGRALELIAPGAGLLIIGSSTPIEVHCGLMNARAVKEALSASWPFSATGEVVVLVVLVALGWRGVGLARLRAHQAVATVLTLIAAPPLAVLACIATGFETDNGGAGTVVLLPTAIAAGATIVAWSAGRSFATVTALRRLAVAVLTLGVGMVLVLFSRPTLAATCTSFLTTVTWGLAADGGWVIAPCLAVVLYFARDPVAPLPASL